MSVNLRPKVKQIDSLLQYLKSNENGMRISKYLKSNSCYTTFYYRMAKILMFFMFMGTWRIGDTQGGDICNKNAILKKHDEVYLSREVKANIELDYSDFIAAMDQILNAKDSFVREVSKYATIPDLKAQEPNKLIKFNNRVNLIKVVGTVGEIMKKCVSMHSNAE